MGCRELEGPYLWGLRGNFGGLVWVGKKSVSNNFLFLKEVIHLIFNVNKGWEITKNYPKANLGEFWRILANPRLIRLSERFAKS